VEAVERAFREEAGAALATLIRLLGGFDLAEECLQEAYAAALEQWPRDGVPAHARSWLIRVARNRGIDRLRRRSRFEAPMPEHPSFAAPPPPEPEPLEDDRLRLIFTCCHPAIAPENQIALALRTICGLSTAEIARAFLVPEPTLAQRLVRAKTKIRDAGIPYEVPQPARLPERLDRVWRTLYLLFTEGYSASDGDAQIRAPLCDEAIRLARLLAQLLPREGETHGLLALMLLHHSRQSARLGPGGDLITLDEQDRSLWDRARIAEGCLALQAAIALRSQGGYTIQAAIAALHAQSAGPAETDWAQIAALYSNLYEREPTPVIALNWGIAIGMADGPEAGLRFLDPLSTEPSMGSYHLFHAARADFYRRLGRKAEAGVHYRLSLEFARNEVERRYLERRLREVML
jgi:RNA polymerase sigma-70 factor (ECF subfamily)